MRTGGRRLSPENFGSIIENNMNCAKVLVTGAGGMLGHALVKVLDSEYELVSVTHSQLDITDSAQVLKILEKEKPTVLINSAAYTKVDDCEKNIELAHRVNGQAMGEMANICQEMGIFLVHFSTDYVFDGQKKTPYLEEDETNPLNVYGASKLEGEKKIAEHLNRFLIIRTSWLYGSHGPNFVDKILQLANEVRSGLRKELQVVDDQFGSPTYTVDLAHAVKFLLDKGFYGFLHVTNWESCSWYEFAKEILRIVKYDNIPIRNIKSVEMKRPAKRPVYSVLSNERLKLLGYQMQLWSDALDDYVKVLPARKLSAFAEDHGR
jgi:dTDP-4-dehydrorhamnose reductase